MVKTRDIVRVNRRALHEGVGRDGSGARRRFGVRARRARREKHQDRLCQSADRAARRLRRSGQFRHLEFSRGGESRRQGRQRDLSGRSRGEGQPVQSQPRRRGREGADRRQQDRPDAGRLDAGDDQSGGDAMRDRGGALRLQRRAVAAVLHRPAGQSGGGPPAWKPFNYTYHFFWGLEDVIAVFTNMWSQLETNKSVGGLFPNDGDGNAWGDKTVGFPPVLDKLGYKLTDPGRYQNLTDDFCAQINAFKKANCDIITGVVLPPDFTTFWKQALQQGLKPKAASIGKAILFPVAVEALGGDGNNLSSEVWWSPNHPFKSSLTGMSAKGARRRLSERDQEAVDAADRLHPCAVRGRRRRDEALARRRRQQGDRQGDRRDQSRHGRRQHRVGGPEPAAVRAEEHRQDAAGRRPVAAQAAATSTISSSPTTDRAGNPGRRPMEPIA